MSIFVKKTCVLKQMKNGYGADGGTVSGFINVERYGRRIYCKATLINFAPLSEGNYCLVLSDRAGETFSFPLRADGGSGEDDSALDVSKGFLAVVCYADSNEYQAIACGINGENVYEIGSLLFRLFSFRKDTVLSAVSEPEETPTKPKEKKSEKSAYYNKDKETEKIPSDPTIFPMKSNEKIYDDEALAQENFYEFSSDGETEDNLLSASILRAFKVSGGDTYYQSVRSELDDVFNANPTDDSLKKIFPYSLWVRLSDGKDKGDLVGVIFEKLVVRYVCYAVRKKTDTKQPKHSCFVPCSFFAGETEGFYITFRDAETGAYAECYTSPPVES